MKKSWMMFCTMASMSILCSNSLLALNEVKILFSGYSTYHIEYSADHTPSGTYPTELLELAFDDGNGNEYILASNSTSILGKEEVVVSNPGSYVSFTVRVKFIDNGGATYYEEIWSESAKTTEVKGIPQFNCLIECPDPAKLTDLDFGGTLIDIPTGISVTIKNVRANNTDGTVWQNPFWSTDFKVNTNSNLVLDNCEFLGFNAEGTGNLKMTKCVFAGIAFDTYFSVGGLASVEVKKCRFDGSSSLGGSIAPVGTLKIDDSLFLNNYASPYFNALQSISVNGCDFRNGPSSDKSVGVVAQNSATVSVTNCVFKSYLEVSQDTSPGAISVSGCHFWDGYGIMVQGTGTVSANSCYWGNDGGATSAPGWISNSGAENGGLVTVTNPLKKSQALDKICSRTDPLHIPNIWVAEKVIGQNILTPVPYSSFDNVYLMRKGRDTMLCFDVRADTASLSGIKFFIEWNGQRIDPVNPNLTIMRDYGKYSPYSNNREMSEEPDQRTINFIIPADKTYVNTNTEVRLFADTTGLTGYIEAGNAKDELCNFYVSFKNPFARKLRVGVIPVNIMAFGYKHYIDAGKHGEALTTIKNDLSQKWPLKPDEEIEIIRMPAYNYIGAISSFSSSAFSIALTWELAATRSIANALVNNKPIDRIVAVVPAGSITDKGINSDKYSSISIVREDTLFSAIHELGHSIGLYPGEPKDEQYNLPNGPDTAGNQIEFDAGAYVHGLTCFKPDQNAARVTSFNRRYRHIPQGSYGVMFDFMGLAPNQWIIKSSLAKVYTGLETLLGVNPNPPKPIPDGYRRVFFSGVIKKATISTGSVLCRNSGELLNEIKDGTQKLNVTMKAYDDTGTVLSTEECVCGLPSEDWPWLQTFDVKAEATRYELTDATGRVIYNSDNPGVTITNAFTGPDPGVINSTVKLNFSATTTKSGRLATKQENASSPVRHQLYCSYDGGTEWIPVSGTQLQDGEVEIQSESLQASPTISFKLVSANGFTQTEKILSGYSLDNHSPSVSISSPLDGSSAQTGTVWTLSASAFDIEDGEIANGTWTSSLDGLLGTGALIEGVVLKDGTHTITFTAKDSKGAEATKSITVTAGQASPDLSIGADALQFHIPGTDPIYGNPTAPQIEKANKVSLSVHNQGITTQCSLKLYVTPPGGAETLLSEATFDWAPFADYTLQAEYTPPGQGTYVFKGLLEPKDFSDPDTSNNQRAWTFQNTAPVARDIETVLLEAGASDILLDAEDEDGDNLTFSITVNPQNGTATLDGDIVTYTPSIAPGITSDTFKYKANDGTADSNEATVTIEFQFDVPATAEMTMAASPANGGTTTPSAGAANTVNTNEAQNITAKPANNFVFANWTSNPEGTALFADANSANTTATLYGDATITANFNSTSAAYNLTMAVAPADSGTTTPTIGIHPLNAGVAQDITATATKGYAFTNWTADANAVLADANSANTTVTISGNSTVTANFAKTGSITVASPNGGEQWASGTTRDITWTADEVAGNLKIELLRQGKSALTITDSAGGGTYSWTIPPATDLAPGAFYKIKISKDGTTVSDESDNYFSIVGTDASITVTSPLEGNAWTMNTAKDITWESTGTVNNLGIYLFRNGIELASIATSQLDDGTFSWNLPPASDTTDKIEPGTGYYLKIVNGDDPAVYGLSGKFSIVESATAELTINVVPAGGGTTNPNEGAVTINQGQPQDITATPEIGYNFVRWLSKSGNANIADPLSSATTVTLTGNADIYAIFSDGEAENIFDPTKSKVKFQFDDTAANKDKVSIAKAVIPATFPQPKANSDITIYFDDFSMEIAAKCNISGTKISFKGEDGDKNNKFSLVFDFKKYEWSFNLSKADMNGLIDTFDGVDIVLDVDGTVISQNIELDEQVNWSFVNKDGNNPTENLDITGGQWEDFDIADLKGKIITNKDNKDLLSVNKATCKNITIDPNEDALQIVIGDVEYNMEDFEGKWVVTPDLSKHSIKAKQIGGVMTLNLVLDFTKDAGTWKLKLGGCDFKDLVDGKDGLDVRLMIGNYEGAVRVPVTQKTVLTYPMK